MSKRVWKSGPPPSLGWWPCGCDWIRWWDGEQWSWGAKPGAMPSTVAKAARMKAFCSEGITWTDRPKSWPARSRT